MEKGMLFVVSGPSGVGKGTIKKVLLERNPNLIESISCTTRKPREGEKEGISYFFKSEQEFDDLVYNHMFLEYAGVFERRYGTLREFVEEKLETGHDVLLEIDVQGAMQVRGSMEDAVLIMLAPPSLPELVNRLTNRGTETKEQIEKRFAKSKQELLKSRSFDYVVINDTIEKTCVKIEKILLCERYRAKRNMGLINDIIGSI